MRDKPKISACLIIWNEGENIYNCLNSIKDVVNEIIIIIDTRTDDNTIAEIERFAKDWLEQTPFELHESYDKEAILSRYERYRDKEIKLYFKKWNDHFAEMRNYSLSKATGDYIFVIDGDEVLEQWQEINDEYDFYICKTVIGDSGFDGVRLFKNLTQVKYQNPRHATVDSSLAGLKGAISQIKVRHPSISKDELDKKIKHNLEIHLSESPNVAQNYNLLRCYLYLKDWDNAIKYGELALQDGLNTQTKAVICAQLYHAFFNKGIIRDDLLKLSLAYTPRQMMSRIVLAGLFYRQGKQAEANGLVNIAEEFNNNYLEKGIYTDFPNEKYYQKEDFLQLKQKLQEI